MANESTPILVNPVPDNSGAAVWTPTRGQEIEDFLDNVVPQVSRETVREAALSILSKGVSPTATAGQETGLVVGYVQSGKTMSFEAVAALARDNDFRIVIVIAGTAIPLLTQSTDRLSRDLRLDDPNRARRWIPFKNPTADDAIVHPIRDVLDEWRDPATPEEYRKTVLITVLKHHRHLLSLTSLLRALDLEGVPVLIIDDEADQASLNTEVGRGLQSTTYRRLMELRQVLPIHTYLQYTATPQAPLLISIIDSLSPNFVEVLEPGEAYVGGREFFADNLNLVRQIPPEDVPLRSSPVIEPPESLLQALRLFMVGVTAGLRAGPNTGNRSMLVHPSHLTEQHQEFYNWVRDVFEEWKRILTLPDTDPDKLELIEDFRDAYDDLRETTGPELLAFDQLVASLRLGFTNTRVLEVNAREGATPPVDWRSSYGWILVGARAMDRGFTIEGLTVTYMPRGTGVGNADTVQQRARFFGYKRSYLGFCRLYLEQGTLSAFQRYVDHEEDIRGQLQSIQREDRHLNDWKRAFILDAALRPCRRAVLELDYMRGEISDMWVTPRVVHAADSVIEANRVTVARFAEQMIFEDDVGHPDRTTTQRHEVCRQVPLRAVIEQLLGRMRVPGVADSSLNTGMLLQLSRALESDPDEPCTIYRMSPRERRKRGIAASGEVRQLFQGEAPVEPRERRGEVYPGDRAIRDGETVTVQLHTLDLTINDEVVEFDVPAVAVWIPARLSQGWVTQDQPQQDCG